jgi:hypothetical protein
MAYPPGVEERSKAAKSVSDDACIEALYNRPCHAGRMALSCLIPA